MLKPLFCLDGDIHHPPGVPEKGKALPRDAHDAGGAVEERDPQFLFQGMDLLGHRRLGDVQLLRRTGKIERFGNSQKTGQLKCVHCVLPRKNQVLINKSLLLITAFSEFTFKRESV